MSLLSFFKGKKGVFTEEENKQIVEAIRDAENQTSGEVRVFIESRCSFVDAMDRAAELFYQLEMDETKDKNAVLLYIALKDKQLAIYGDEGIYKKLGKEYWNQEIAKMIRNFDKADYARGICEVVNDIGEALKKEFPYNQVADKNELPDEIIFGK